MKVLYPFLVFLVLPLLGLAQSEERYEFSRYEGMTLIDALEILNEKEGINFSFSPAALQGITVPKIKKRTTISSFLSQTLENTTLRFEVISETFVIVPRKDKGKSNFSLSGLVRDSLTGESLPYATIGVVSNKISTTTNTDGKFTLLNVPSDTSELRVSYLGYRPVVKAIGSEAANEGYIVLNMVPQKRNLPSIEVTARGNDLLEIDKTISQVTFNPIEIGNLPNLGEPDVFAALRRLPGISGGTDSDSGLRIRGGQTDQNLVMFDGIPVYHIDHLFGFLSAFNSNVIKNIQVNKGGFEAKYGGRSSGVVNITGIDGNKVSPSIQAEATLLSVNFLAELPVVTNKASLVFAYRRSYTDIIQSPTYRNIFNNLFNSSLPNIEASSANVFEGENEPDYFFYDLNAKFNFKPTQKDAISLSYYQGKDDLQIAFNGTLEELNRITDDQTDWGNQGGSLKWSRKWNKKLFTYANYGVSRYVSNLEADERFFFQSELISQRSFEQRVEVADNTFRLDNTYALDPLTRFEFGWWNTLNSIESQAQDQNSVLRDSTVSAVSNAFYAQMEREIGTVTFQMGLRATHYSETEEIYPEPRISASKKFGNLTLQASYGIFHQMVRRLNERSLYFSVPETWTLAGDQTVPVLRSDHYIAGLTYSLAELEFSLEGYHKYERGVVEYLFPEFGIPTGDLEQFALDGRKRIFGIDFLLKRSFGKQSILAGYTYLNSESKYDGINNSEYFPSPGVSNHEFSAIYNLEYKRWDFSAGFVLANGIPFTPVLGTFIVTLPNGEEQQFVSLGRINSERVEWYHRLDLSAGYTIPLKKGIFQTGVSVYNIYDNLAVKFVDYFQIPQEESDFYTLGQRDIFSLGITPSVFLKLKL